VGTIAARDRAHPTRDVGETRAALPNSRSPRCHSGIGPAWPWHAQPGDLGAHDRRCCRSARDRSRGVELRSA
jgi:hypothetical protein